MSDEKRSPEGSVVNAQVAISLGEAVSDGGTNPQIHALSLIHI